MAIYSCPQCSELFEADPNLGTVVACPHCNSTVSIPAPPKEIKPGEVLGGFEVIREIGKGGMGNVYLANQISMDRQVALKVLPREFTEDREAVEQFMKEVRFSGRLTHPFIVTAIDAGEDDGVCYLAMTYVEGRDLDQLVEADGPTSDKQALKYALKIADALNYAWEKHKLLHRDIKPGNIMVNEAGEAYLLDMGIAQHISETLERQEIVEGSPYYMSPEQSRGEPLDWRTDLYSLGATLYNLIAGVPPYDNDDVSKIVDMHSEAPFPEPETRNPEVKIIPEVTAVLKKMMEKNPDDRYNSWNEFQSEVRKILAKMKQTAKVPASKGKKFVLSKSSADLRGNVKSKARKLSQLLRILIILAIAVLAVIGAGAILKFTNDHSARTALRKARQYSKQPSCDKGKAYRLFAQAKKASDKFLVSLELNSQANSEYQKIRDEVMALRAKMKKFSDTFKEANYLYGDATRLQKEGVTAFNATRNDKDKLNEALEKCSRIFPLLDSLKDIPGKQEQLKIKIFRRRVKELMAAIRKQQWEMQLQKR